MHVLADCAFRASAHVMPVLRGGRTNPALAAVNSLLTHSRVGVEQGFGSLVSQFKYIQGDQLQLKKMPTTNIQKACILFYNLKCCIHGSNTTEWSTPPSLEDYSQTVLGMNPWWWGGGSWVPATSFQTSLWDRSRHTNEDDDVCHMRDVKKLRL